MTATARKAHSRELIAAVLFLGLSASEKLVLMALCWHYPKAYPSLARIAALASQSERWVRHCLRSLQKKGLIQVHYRRDGQVQDTNSYTINPDRILMQAGKRAKTTLETGGTQFLGVGNSRPADRGELTSPKQSTLKKEKEQQQSGKQGNITAGESPQPTCQQEEIPIYQDLFPLAEVILDQHAGEILADSPHDEFADQIIETQPENIEPCLQQPVSSELNNPTHPHPSASSSPPSPSLPAAGNENVAPEANATKKAVTSPPPSSDALPSPTELANMSPWDRAYEQALDAWRKEHANLTPAEARGAFGNDTEFVTRVAKIFHGAQEAREEAAQLSKGSEQGRR